MADRKEVEKVVKTLVAKVFQKDEADLAPTTELVADLGARSLQMIGLSSMVQDEWDIFCSVDNLYDAKTVAGVADFVCSKLAEANK